jgi:2-phosphoglycerate kinase
MTELNQNLRVILIGGSSHTGKSTLAQALANRLGWQYISTDTLARHPGRPWKTKPQTVPAHVAEHYLSLPVEELLADVLRHYKNLWPRIEALITTHATDLSTERLVLEGSALWPESVATLDVASVTAVWLTASDTFFRTRIYNESKFAEATARGQAMIEKFLARTQLYNERMMTAVTHLNLPYLNVEQSPSIDELGSVDISRGSAKRVHQTKC